MRSSMRFVLAGGLLAIGYFVGSSHRVDVAYAQPEEAPLSDDAIKKISEAHTALKSAAQQLALESRYSSVTKTVNPFSVLVGGIDVKEDLGAETGSIPIPSRH